MKIKNSMQINISPICTFEFTNVTFLAQSVAIALLYLGRNSFYYLGLNASIAQDP